MSLLAGDAREGTGMAGAIADKMKELEPGFKLDTAWRFINAISEAVVDHIQENAEVTVTGVTAGPDEATGEVS